METLLEKKAKARTVKKPLTFAGVQRGTLRIMLTGTEPLICHQFSDKARRTMADKQQGKAIGTKEKKNPFNEMMGCFYILDPKSVAKIKPIEVGDTLPYIKGAFGFPCSGFKKAAIATGSFIDGIQKIQIAGALHVNGRMAELVYDHIEMVEDPVRVGMGKADLRYRPYFHEWSTTLEIEYNANVFTPEMLATIWEAAGFHIGIGDWRPQKSGSFGRFRVGK